MIDWERIVTSTFPAPDNTTAPPSAAKGETDRQRDATNDSYPEELSLVGCLTFWQHASVSQGRICSDTCCHTEIVVADQTFCPHPVTID